jgi:hypothetical protein
MAVVKVWNDNKYEHVESFKGNEVRIKPGEFVEMDYIDAKDFQGQFTGLKMKGPNDPDPTNFKMIRVEDPTEAVIKEDTNIVHATGQKAGSVAELITLLKAHTDANPDLVADDAEAERANVKRSSEIADLKAQVAELTALVKGTFKGKPGKPKLKAQG